MMHHTTELELQAYADNELSASEAKRVEQVLKDNPQARAVLEELQYAKSIFAAGEVELAAPEGREFYWSKIRRGIVSGQQGSRADRVGFWRRPWIRFGLPVASVALVMVVIALLNKPKEEADSLAGYFHEIEAPLAEGDAITFHSESAAMTIVWVDSRGY